VNQPPAEAADALLGLYRQLARAFGCHRHGQPYNLLVTREWMLIVPRARGQWRGISVNGLGFAGALMVPGREELDVVRPRGPAARAGARRSAPQDRRELRRRGEPRAQRAEGGIVAQRLARGVA
jgi:ATP adenylyltransferase